MDVARTKRQVTLITMIIVTLLIAILIMYVIVVKPIDSTGAVSPGMLNSKTLGYSLALAATTLLTYLYWSGREYSLHIGVIAFPMLVPFVFSASQFEQAIPQGLLIPFVVALAVSSMRVAIIVQLSTISIAIAIFPNAYHNVTTVVTTAILTVLLVATRLIQESTQRASDDAKRRAIKSESLTKDAEIRYRTLASGAFEGIAVTQVGRFVDSNERLIKMLGYSRDELIGMSISTLLVPFEQDLVFSNINSGSESLVAHQMICKDGTLIHVEAHGKTIDVDGHPTRITAIRDVTERNRAQEALMESESRFREVFDSVSDAIFMQDADSGQIVDVNRRMSEMYGYTHEQAIACHVDELSAGTPPYSTGEAAEIMRRAITVGPQTFEWLAKARDGHLFWVEVGMRLATIRSRIRILAVVRDITPRKALEVSLRLAASVFKHSHEAITITDSENRVIDVNPAFTRITGYERDEVIGKNPRILSSGRHAPGFYVAMWKSLLANDFWAGEIWNKRKNGEIYIERLSISRVRNEKGEVRHHIAIFSDISEAKQHENELHRIAYFDPLTGLPNRRFLAERLGNSIAHACTSKNQLAVCYLDLDGFKPINDRLGHRAGDQLLVELSTRIKTVLRSGDTIGRLGGDEFVLLLADLSRTEECFVIIERVLEVVRAPVLVEGVPVCVSASIGITLCPPDETDPDILLRHSDQAMYRAKEDGKNRYHLFDPEHDRQIKARRHNIQRLEEALKRDEFVLYYQPKVDLVTGDVIGAEALIRWQHPKKGLLPPADFLGHLESSTLEISVGEWVIESALQQIEAWLPYWPDFVASVNIGAYHLLQPDFSDRLQLILDRHQTVSPRHLELEILETAALSDMQMATRAIVRCRDFGVRFAIDDFGTGYSSLAYFRSLPVDILKIDQSFVRDMLVDPNDREIVDSVVKLAKAFNRPVIAEGVETLEHGALLLSIGCRLCQGYGIARPMAPEYLLPWIDQWRAMEAWVGLVSQPRITASILSGDKDITADTSE